MDVIKYNNRSTMSVFLTTRLHEFIMEILVNRLNYLLLSKHGLSISLTGN